MSMSDQEDNRNYSVVKNQEEQYSIYPSDQEIPAGWVKAGKEAVSKQECLDYIREVWTDMTPLSVRKAVEQSTAQTADAKSVGKKKAGKKKTDHQNTKTTKTEDTSTDST